MEIKREKGRGREGRFPGHRSHDITPQNTVVGIHIHVPLLAGVVAFLDGVEDEFSAPMRAAKDFGFPAP